MTSISTINKHSLMNTATNSPNLYNVSSIECLIKTLEVNVRVADKSSSTKITDFFKLKNNNGKNIAFLMVGNTQINLSDYDRRALIANKGEILFQNNAYTFHYNGFDSITAYCLQTLEEVGEIKFNQKQDDVYFWLDYIEVKPGYQRLGIGTNLIKAALLVEPELQIDLNFAKGHEYSSNINSGHALVEHCINLGLITLDMNLLDSQTISANTESNVEKPVMSL